MMPAGRFARVFLGMLVFFGTAAAHACPVCHSATGFAVRAALFNGHFVRTLATVALPCPLLLLAVALVHVAMPDLQEIEASAQSNVTGETSPTVSRAAA